MSQRWLPFLALLSACSGSSSPVEMDGSLPVGMDGDDGRGDDASVMHDASTDPTRDAGQTGPDAHVEPDAALPGDASVPDDSGTPPRGPYPFRTRGRYVVNAYGERVKLASVNWYGASDIKLVPSGLNTAKLADIVQTIKRMGFNSVRLPFANFMIHQTGIDPNALSANPELAGMTPLEVYDATVKALTDAGIYVLLNNHTTRGMWCCSFDSDGLWYTTDYTEDQWVEDWAFMAERYKHDPLVIAADLRNEVRIANQGTDLIPLIPVEPNWARQPNSWRVAAERAGARVLEVNPELLVVVEGVNYPRVHLQGVAADPIRLPLPNRLIYAAHNYGYIGPELTGIQYGQMDWPTFKAQMDKEWGYVIEEARAYTAPVWVSEFGEGPDRSPWWDNLVRYLREGDFDFAYWALNPGPKPSGDDEPYGLLERDWVTPLDDHRTQDLASLAVPTTGPGVEAAYEEDPAHHLQALLFSDWDSHATEPYVDWQPSTYKATCAENAHLVGLSAINRASQRLGHIALCSSWKAPVQGARTLVANGGGDSPNATAHTGGQDWSPYNTKLACPVGQEVVGISQSRLALSYRIEGLLCADSGRDVSTCTTVSFWGTNTRRSDVGGDWDGGGEKAQCAEGEYVAGVSLSNGTPHSILCCAP